MEQVRSDLPRDCAPLTSHAVDMLIDAAKITSGARAIELGCGPGHICKQMADAGAKVTGVDISPEMVALARRTYADIEFLQGSADELSLDGDTFDVALINFSIHHFARPSMAIAEVRRVLKPGGRLVFAGPIEQGGFGAFIAGLTAHPRPHLHGGDA